MRTVKRNPFLSGVCAILGGAVLWAGAASADVISDRAAGIIIFPKLVYNETTNTDTVIQISNTSTDLINVHCFYVNANSHCTNDPGMVCNTNDDCQGAGIGGICVEGWIETDFRFALTALQPVFWRLSEGDQFFPLDGLNKVGVDGQFNENSAVPPAPEEPFAGELKCVQVGPDDAPVDRNDLKGEATIVTVNDTLFDAREYNAIGILAIEGAEGHGDKDLVIGEEYNSCPNILILDHFFDDAVEPINDNYVRSHLTIVPCSQDFDTQITFPTTVQFLVFNEFEQRFSTSTSVRCYSDLPLSDIDTANRSLTDDDPTTTNDLRSIFNVNVQGTLTGQTRIRGVDDGSEEHGNGILAVAEEFHRSSLVDLDTVVGSAAFNIHYVGERDTTDIIRLP